MKPGVKVTLLCSFFYLLILTGRVNAADDAGNYAIWGAGNTTCHHYNNARKAGEDDKYKDFLMGYLTAYNTLTDDTYRITGTSNMTTLLETFDQKCKLAPVSSFELVLREIIQELYKERMKKPESKQKRVW
jgi:hypothetical protein